MTDYINKSLQAHQGKAITLLPADTISFTVAEFGLNNLSGDPQFSWDGSGTAGVLQLGATGGNIPKLQFGGTGGSQDGPWELFDDSGSLRLTNDNLTAASKDVLNLDTSLMTIGNATDETPVDIYGLRTLVADPASSDTINITGSLIISQDLTVDGTTTTINTETLTVEDNVIELAKGNIGDSLDIGWIGDRGADSIGGGGDSNIAVFWDHTNNTFAMVTTNDDASTPGLDITPIDYMPLRVGSVYASDAGLTSQFAGNVDAELGLDVSGGQLTANAGGTFSGSTDWLFSGGDVHLNDNINLELGSSKELTLVHTGAAASFVNTTGSWEFDNQETTAGTRTYFSLGTDDGDTAFQVRDNTGNGLLTVFGSGQVDILTALNLPFQDSIAAEGNIRYHSGDKDVQYFNGTDWIVLAAATGSVTLQAAYDAGQTITLSDAKGDMEIILDETAADYTNFVVRGEGASLGGSNQYLQTDAENTRLLLGESGAVDVYMQDSDLLWVTDGGGDIGGSADNRPDHVYAKTELKAGDSVSITTDAVTCTGGTLTIDVATGSEAIVLSPGTGGQVSLTQTLVAGFDTSSLWINTTGADTQGSALRGRMTSPGLSVGSAVLSAAKLDTVTNAGDSDGTIAGLHLDFTDNGGTAESRGIYFDSGYDVEIEFAGDYAKLLSNNGYVQVRGPSGTAGTVSALDSTHSVAIGMSHETTKGVINTDGRLELQATTDILLTCGGGDLEVLPDGVGTYSFGNSTNYWGEIHGVHSFLREGADPTNVANTGVLYTKDDGSGNTELYYMDESGNVTQLTPGTSGGLQTAYEVGNTITLADSTGDLEFIIDETNPGADFIVRGEGASLGSSNEYIVTDGEASYLRLGEASATATLIGTQVRGGLMVTDSLDGANDAALTATGEVGRNVAIGERQFVSLTSMTSGGLAGDGVGDDGATAIAVAASFEGDASDVAGAAVIGLGSVFMGANGGGAFGAGLMLANPTNDAQYFTHILLDGNSGGEDAQTIAAGTNMLLSAMDGAIYLAPDNEETYLNGSHLYFDADGGHDIGQAADYRPGNVYVSTQVDIAGALALTGTAVTADGALTISSGGAPGNDLEINSDNFLKLSAGTDSDIWEVVQDGRGTAWKINDGSEDILWVDTNTDDIEAIYPFTVTYGTIQTGERAIYSNSTTAADATGAHGINSTLTSGGLTGSQSIDAVVGSVIGVAGDTSATANLNAFSAVAGGVGAANKTALNIGAGFDYDILMSAAQAEVTAVNALNVFSGLDMTITMSNDTDDAHELNLGAVNPSASVGGTGTGDCTVNIYAKTDLNLTVEDDDITLSPGTNGVVYVNTALNLPRGTNNATAGNIRYDTTGDGSVWYYDDTGTWVQLASAVGTTLQAAYEAGNTIDLDDGQGDLAITLDETGTFADFTVTSTTGNYLSTDAENDTVDIGDTGGVDVAIAGTEITLGDGTSTITLTGGALTLDIEASSTWSFDANDADALTLDDGTNDYLVLNTLTNSKQVELEQFLRTPRGDDVNTTTGAAGGGVVMADGDGGALAVGYIAYAQYSGGETKALRADAGAPHSIGAPDQANVFGVVVAKDGTECQINTIHGMPVPVYFAAAPGTADNGQVVYLATDPGEATLSPPSAPETDVWQLGILVGADGATQTPNVIWMPQFRYSNA